MISHLGAMVPVISGMLLAKRMRGETGFVGGTSLGDGAMSTGSAHEGLNLAAVEKLPLVVSVANNQFAYSTPTDRQYACNSLVDRAQGYGMEGYEIDGTDFLTCLSTFRHAVARAREGHGPQMVVGKLLRLTGHGEHDDASYVPEALLQSHEGRDCLSVARAQLLEMGWEDEESFERIDAECRDEISTAVSLAEKDPLPDPYRESWNALRSSFRNDG